jgi:hypothetical protein
MRWDFVRHLRNASKISCVISMQMNQKALSSHIGEEHGSCPKSVIEVEVSFMQRLARKVAGVNPRFI